MTLYESFVRLMKAMDKDRMPELKAWKKMTHEEQDSVLFYAVEVMNGEEE